MQSEDDSNVPRNSVCNDVFDAESTTLLAISARTAFPYGRSPKLQVTYETRAAHSLLTQADAKANGRSVILSFSGFAPDSCTCADYSRSVSNLVRNFSFGTQPVANYNPLSFFMSGFDS